MPRIQKILVPVDGSPPSVAALQYAVALAEDLGASVDTLRVVAPARGAAPGDDELVREMDRAIDAASARLGGRLQRRSETGDPVRRILEIAARDGFHLVVMGTHGRVGRLHALAGSVTEDVVRNASCPVLTVRDSGGAAESFAERIHHTPSLADQTRPR